MVAFVALVALAAAAASVSFCYWAVSLVMFVGVISPSVMVPTVVSV